MKTVGEIESGEEAEPNTTTASDNGSSAVAADGSQSADVEQSASSESTESETTSTAANAHTKPNTKSSSPSTPADGKESLSLPARKATGPRSMLGKQRSSRNALKHGIFSSARLLGGEETKLYRSLLRRLDESVRPEGMLESILVEKLATTVCRYRRLLLVESAEIQKNIDRVSEEQERLREETLERCLEFDISMSRHCKKGEIFLIDDLGCRRISTLEYCLDLLRAIRWEFKTLGFDNEDDWVYLGRVYGARYEGRPGKDLFDVYLDCKEAYRAPEEERRKRGFPSTKDCFDKFSVELDKEIARIEALYRAARPADFELLTCKVPDAPVLDRLLRYEASLERSFDRTLSQLERLQRMRLGQPVLPPIDVNVSAS